MKRECGVTLIELMVTLAVAAILMTIAVPGMQTFITNNTLAGTGSDFLGILNFARSEAVKRGITVTICPSSNGTSCTGTWSGGWLAFVDNNTNATVDASDVKLRVHPALTANYSAGASLTDSNGNAVNYITYSRNGMSNETGTMAFCYQNNTQKAQAVTITLTRPRLAPDTDGDAIPNKENGSNITSCAAP